MITQATKRGYVAVSMSFASGTTKVSMTAKKDMTVEGENGASVTLKAGEKFTVVRAASLGENMWYIVRDVIGEKKCTCAAMKPCRHEKLVAGSQPVSVLGEYKMSDEVYEKLAVIAREKQSTMMNAPLNGNKAFSILR